MQHFWLANIDTQWYNWLNNINIPIIISSFNYSDILFLKNQLGLKVCQASQENAIKIASGLNFKRNFSCNWLIPHRQVYSVSVHLIALETDYGGNHIYYHNSLIFSLLIFMVIYCTGIPLLMGYKTTKINQN